MKRIFRLTLIGCLTFSLTPSVSGFIVYDHGYRSPFNTLIHKVHEPSWKIGYRYGAECKPEDRQDKVLEKAITKALQTWLQPLRDLKTTKPVVNDFRYSINADRLSSDMVVTFHCVQGESRARIHTTNAPEIVLRRGTVVNDKFMFSLVHEIGHAFGLQDTYVKGREHTSTGGLQATVGTQPSSVMSIYGYSGTLLTISEDDKRGIVWIYKILHGGLAPSDCFFSDYVYEQEPPGCRPKHPLIFEVKHGHPKFAIKILDDDPKIDINAQDAGGLTALHYAVMYEKEEVVEKLLTHKNIKPFLLDKQGRSALDIARGTAKLTDIINLLEALDTQRTVEDVNGDGTVNILDLVIVSANFGKTGKNIADVDGNSVVDIRDLVKVAGMFGDAAAL